MGDQAAQIRLRAAISANVMLRIHGDRDSLLAALAAQWADQQLQIPSMLKPAVRPIRGLGCVRAEWPRKKWIETASAPARQLVAQGSDGPLLGPLHRHGAELHALGRRPQRQAHKDGEPQRCNRGGGQVIHQLPQHQAMHGLAHRRLGFWSGQLIEQAGLAIGLGIEAEMPQRALALLMQPARHAHQPHPIAQVVLQGAPDAAAQIGRSRLAGPAAGSGADQGLAGHLDQILPLHQREQAPGQAGDGIGQGQVLQHQGITGPGQNG